MLRVGGVWVSPIEIEIVLTRHPAVLECAVVGVPDDNRMIKPKAFVVLDDREARAVNGMAEELRDFCRANLAHIKCPRWIDIVTDLPKTATGKIQRFRLR
jgi:acyl-coenzyme A synthetase/AMP-(fatty) acid ligase